jgi:hypothetical protein
MKQRLMTVFSVLFGTVLMSSCADGPSTSVDRGSLSQQDTAMAVLDYRRLASELRQMADRRELEAEMLSRQQDADQAMIAHWREMAQQLRKEADAADQHAQEMQRHVPHGMVQ